MPHSIPAGEAVIDLGHMSSGNKDLQLLLISLLSNNPGDNSAEAIQEDVEGVPTPVFLSRVHLNHINDNYCSDPACVKTVTKQLDLMSDPVLGVVVSFQVVNQDQVNCSKPVFRKALNTVVYCGVVNSNGHLQKKGLSPDPRLNEIKHMSKVFLV